MGRHAAPAARLSRKARRRGLGVVAVATLVGAAATGGVAVLGAGSTDAAFTDTEAASGSVAAAKIAAPSGFRCTNVLTLLLPQLGWDAASPALPTTHQYRYVLSKYPDGTVLYTGTDRTYTVSLLNVGTSEYMLQAQVLRSDTATSWVSSTVYLRVSAKLIGGTTCTSFTP